MGCPQQPFHVCLRAAPCSATKPTTSKTTLEQVQDALLNPRGPRFPCGPRPRWIYFASFRDSTTYEESSKKKPTKTFMLRFPITSLEIQDESPSWTAFSRKASSSLQKHAFHRALNLKRQPCCQRALTTRDAPGVVRLLFTRSYFKMSKGFCMSDERDRRLSEHRGGRTVSDGHPFTGALLPTQPSASCFPRHQNLGEKPPFSP